MHKRIHSGENPHQCHLCLKAFSERSKLRIICKHIKKKNLILAINDKKTFLTEVIWRSTSEQIQVKKAYSCNQCPTVFSQGGGLKGHMRTHSSKKRHPCNQRLVDTFDEKACRHIANTFRRKTLFLQSMLKRLFWQKWFEESHPNKFRWKKHTLAINAQQLSHK